jgi:hypothetical protein|uniref:Uncharacterized protein n=1 Tax=Sipha flava TaxID=143950 RepID=A0A2S2R2G2_9HEMI
MDENVYQELENRVKGSVNSYKVFGFSHIVVIGSVADIMDSSLRTIIDGMFRRTKTHCKNEEESELYRQRLCKLYLTYFRKGLVNVDLLEPKLAKILTVQVESPNECLADRLAALRLKVAERTKRVKSLLALQSRLKTNTVFAEWTISKVEQPIYEAQKELANVECVSPDDFTFIKNNLNRLRNSINYLDLN